MRPDLGGAAPLIDGEVAARGPARREEGELVWPLAQGEARLAVTESDQGTCLGLTFTLPPGPGPASVGLRLPKVAGAELWLRHGCHSWDGSALLAADISEGHAVTALLAKDRIVVLGFTRHDRFQSRLRVDGEGVALETLWDNVPHDGTLAAEPIVVIEGGDLEETLRAWSRLVAAEAPLQPRAPERRITGWCSWYNHYAAIDEAALLAELAGAKAYRDRWQVPLDVFQIDDGFTPEMGDWLDVKPQFPRGMAPLLAEIEAAGFTPGLWIAPFLVGNRSRLFAEHPEWLVRDRATGGPLVHLRFYGEFRWHKRSEEYHVLDVTHPEAEAYLRTVLRTWHREWGARYFKTDFMNAGIDYGPERARWHVEGLSRVAIWRRMGALIREEIGTSLWLGCGCPLWASIGLVDAVRIGRDVGVKWAGDQSAESLLRDLALRNHGAGILWQADPDCVLLRERFHDLTDEQVRSLALLAGLSGGVLTTSDTLAELSEDRARLFAGLLGAGIDGCDFPGLGSADPCLVQRARRGGTIIATNRFDPTAAPFASALEGLDGL